MPDTMLYPPRPVLETFRDGPDMFRVSHTPNVNPHHDMLVHNVSLGHTHDGELFKVRTRPELYEDWHVDMVNDQREAYMATLPDTYLDWDCHKCKRSVVTDGPAPCPNCGGLF